MNQDFFIYLLNFCVTIYLGDILEFSYTKEDYMNDLNAVFKRFWYAELYVKESKYVFCLKKVGFLGYIVVEDGILVQNSKIDAVRNCPALTSITEFYCFLSLVNYYHRFVKGFARIAAPHTDILCVRSNLTLNKLH